MKRKENETFEAYKKRRRKDKLITELILGGTWHDVTGRKSKYVLANKIAKKLAVL